VAPPFVRPKALDRFVNPLLGKILVPLGLTPRRLHMLTVRGRRSGIARTRPIIVIEHEGNRWLVALSGQADWVRNVRVDPRAQLSAGRRIEAVRLIEAVPADAPAVVKAYVTQWKWNRRYFDHGPDDPPEAFASDVAVHPAFRVEPA
jgi:deazaflavin-dependent oxidoreductase (nitroreductase family)